MKNLLWLLIVCSCVSANAGQSPLVNAGPAQSIYLPVNSTNLTGSATDPDGTPIAYQWTKIAGPSQYNITHPDDQNTAVNNLVAGEYRFQLTATDAQGDVGKDTIHVIVYHTANLSVPSTGSTPNLLGANPGYYGGGWTDPQVYNAMANAGCRSTRSTVPMFFFPVYGDSIRYTEFSYFYNTLGFRDNVFFLYNDINAPFPDRSTEYFNGEQAAIPAGLYQPIWNADGTVNASNSFARYCHTVVKVYGGFTKYFEIWNEPDFTSNWSIASALPGTAGNWWENDPNPTDLINIKAPIQYYIRMLRIAYEVIKRQKPDAVITLGGLGYPSFMHALLRNTDNPVPDVNGKRGSVTPEYPLGAGAYFDGLSFHSYPQYFLKYWDYTTNSMSHKRNSDEAIDQTIRDKNSYEQILKDFGYGSTYPGKSVICTEINIPRKPLNNEIGGIDVQRNFAWKVIAKSARNNISQTYWYVTGEVIDYASAGTYDGFKMMGLYENLLRDAPGQEKLTDEGKANRSAQMLLQDFHYDAASTAAMDLPAGADGAAFKHSTSGEVRFMIWAKTYLDQLESSQVYYSFPQSLVNKQLDLYKWNYCVTGTKASTVQPVGMWLTGEPVILVKTNLDPTVVIPPSAHKPVVFAGNDTTVTTPYIILNGTAWHPDNVGMNCYWEMVSTTRPPADDPHFKSRTTLSPVITGLKRGLYAFRLTASDTRGLYASDTVWVAVDTIVSFINNLPFAYAGRDTTVFVPNPQITLSAIGSMDPDGFITDYQWTLISGPGTATIQNATSQVTQVTALLPGMYIFQLQVTDNQGAISTDIVNVSVDALLSANRAPVIKLVRDTLVHLSSNKLLLSANGSYDPDGFIVSYKWKQLAGPNSSHIHDFGMTVEVDNVQQGVYVFQVIVTDNRGAVSEAKTKVTVRVQSFPVIVKDRMLRIYINKNISGPFTAHIFDANGKLVKRQYQVNQSLTPFISINMQGFPDGIYIISLKSATGLSFTQKFLLQ